ncbi:hypothetical protein ACTXT7_006554 [Hymenolepis weldensis]
MESEDGKYFSGSYQFKSDKPIEEFIDLAKLYCYDSFIPEWNIECSSTGLTVFDDIKMDFEKDDDCITFSYEYPVNSARGRSCEISTNRVTQAKYMKTMVKETILVDIKAESGKPDDSGAEMK